MFISLDLETTGLDKRKDRIIEFGAIKFGLEGTKVKTETFQTFINPRVKIPEFITHITNIRDKDVEDAPKLEEVAAQITEFIGDLPIVGHFISFDTDFLKANNIKLKNPLYDTAEISRIFLPSLPSYSLEILSDIIDLKHEEKHRALDDSIAAKELFLKLIEQIQSLPKEIFDEVKKLSAKSSWDFAKLIQELEHEKSGKPIKTILRLPSDNKTLSTEEKETLEALNTEKKSSLIELINPSSTLVKNISETAKEKTVVLVSYDIFNELPSENKIGSPEKYISLERLNIFKQKESFKPTEITALMKTIVWLSQTENGLTTEGLMFSPDEKAIFSHIQADLETANLEKEPFLQKALELEKKENVIISDYSYIPNQETKHLIIVDAANFIQAIQSRTGQFIDLNAASAPIHNLTSLLKQEASQENLKILEEIQTRLDILFGIAESLFEKNSTNTFFPQPLEITNLETTTANFVKAKEISQSLIATSQELGKIVTPDTLPYLKQWKEVLKTLNSIFADPNLDQSHIWIQKNRNNEIFIRKIPINPAEYFKKLKDNAKKITLIGKSLDAQDNGKLIKDLLGINEDTPLCKIRPSKQTLEKSNIFIAENIRGNANEHLAQTTEFVKKLILKEKGGNVIILNSVMKLEQIHLILAPKLKQEGLTLLAQRGGNLGKILELYKNSPETTSLLLTPNRWEYFDTNSLTKEEEFKNLVIHQIPFDPPSDQYMIALGKNFPDPWNELQIPRAILSLKKIIGKFISQTPGQTIILDNRLIEKNYAKIFTQALEDFVKPTPASVEQILSL